MIGIKNNPAPHFKPKSQLEDLVEFPEERQSIDSDDDKSIMFPRNVPVNASFYEAETGIPNGMSMANRNHAVKKRIFLD